MALLIYSNRCQHSADILNFLDKTPQIKQLVQLHDVNVQGGVPPQYKNKITRVPTLLTKNGKILVGVEVKNWLQSLIPNTQYEHHSLCEGLSSTMSCFSGSEMGGGEGGGDLFQLSDYGQSLQPAMTQELQDKISKKVE
jgi:hypothetical protein